MQTFVVQGPFLFCFYLGLSKFFGLMFLQNEWRAIGVSRVVVFLCNFCGARAISVLFFYLRLLNFLL